MSQKAIGVAVLSILVLLVAAPSLFAATEVRANMDRAGIGFEVDSTYRELSLQVTGEGQVVNRTFAAGAAAYFSPAEFDLPDGEYSFELVVTPDVSSLLEEGARLRGVNRPRGDGNTVFGSFRLQAGAMVLDYGNTPGPDRRDVNPSADGEFASTRLADIVQLDDVIITFSACIGNDCVNGENFGFDTLRLKENNLRIHFDDTSTTASFPSNDWRIVINDSLNGGSNYFAVEDSTAGRQPFRVDAGAPANSLRVDSAGDVGIGKSNPVVELHVTDGDSPTLRLEQDGSSGFQSQTFDIASNEANFFIRDVTNGSQLPFRIKPGADTDSLFIAANNDIGIGTDSPAESLHVRRTNGTAKILVEEASSAAPAARGLLELRNSGTVFARFEDTSTSTVWNFQNQASQAIISSPSGSNVEFTLDTDGNLTLGGSLVTGGSGTCSMTPCDGVFDPEIYTVPSIEDHAAEMWSKKHLPAVGPTLPGQPIDVTDKLTRMLNELEKAHIYIEQLHKRLEALEGAEADAEDLADADM